jgi:FlaA1/EpsC-like NDP-sugar epimerase
MAEFVRRVEQNVSSAGELVRKWAFSDLFVTSDGLSERFGKILYSRTNQLAIDGSLVALTLWVAYMIRFDGQLPASYYRQFLFVLPFAVSLYLESGYVSGIYNLVWRFIGLRDAEAIALGIVPATIISFIYRIVDPAPLPVPFGVLFIHPFLTYSAFVLVRVSRRLLYNHAARERKAPAVRKRLLLIGAGEAGLHLLHELNEAEFKVVGFLDDDIQLQGRTIGGWRVLGTTQQLESIVKKYAVAEVVLCMPSAPKTTLQKVIARCATLPVKVLTVPTLWEIMSGHVTIGRLRSIDPVQMDDLLGRDSVRHPRDFEELTRAYQNQRILVTGAGGSIGSELVRQLKQFKPSQLILLDKDENSLYETACEIKEEFADVTEIVADIRDLELMEKLLERHKPEVVFHAAAYKHVPLMELYPAEAILNNVVGTRNLAEVSDRTGVKIFVLISTDKAVNPTSTMGASKRVAEMIVQKSVARGSRTRFCCVRFGNVLGSRASVVPLFQRQIRQGRNITVTHPDVRRYFMTIPEAVQLVTQAGSLGQRGEIFLLDMGDPVKIVDLAKNLIELSGLVPDKDVRIEFTGLRPGEKLNEELLISGEQGIRSTKYSKIFVVEAVQRDWSHVDAGVEQLEAAAHIGDANAIRTALLALDIGYQNGGSATATEDNDDPESVAKDRDERNRIGKLAPAI